jgi:hypothetical protein
MKGDTEGAIMLYVRAFATVLALSGTGEATGADSLSAASLCGYAPHNHVLLLDRGWHLWLPYPATDPLRAVEFGSGLHSYRAETHTCARLYVTAGTGNISWGSVRIQITETEVKVNGQAAKFETNLAIEPDGTIRPNTFIRTFN